MLCRYTVQRPGGPQPHQPEAALPPFPPMLEYRDVAVRAGGVHLDTLQLAQKCFVYALSIDEEVLKSIDEEEPNLTSNTKPDTTACLGAWYTWARILQTSLEGKGLEHDLVATTIKACFTNNPRI
ncbi:hypothetical protein DY000_02007310 [Brassica cretica]|uniref:Uncharacterized protein n=1 Tax=Brassica cretica TaxID=69181 RepID=A0ABQ7BVU3_BRACR|nr:hypothetical protein DY000_02007310 [Brassica cretica]